MQTATNPQTGEKLVLRGGQWVPLASAGPAVAPVGPMTIGTPRPDKPDDPLDVEGKRLEIELKKQRIAKGDPMGEGAAKVKSEEKTAAFLGTNLVANVNILKNALKVDPNAAAPTWGQIAAGMLGEDARNTVTPDQRQVVYNAQKLITDAALTLGTGAAYTPVQIEAYTRGFFPQVGDSKAAIDAKRESLHAALLAARVKAGDAAPQIDEAMKALGFSSDPLVQGGGGVADNGEGPKGDRWTPEQRGQWQAWLKANPNASVAEADAFLAQHKFPGGIGNLPDVLAAAQKGAISDVEDYSQVDAAAEAAARADLDRQNSEGLFGGESAAGTLVKSGAMLNLMDEASGVGRGLGYALTGKNPVEGYKLGRDTERLRIADARQQLGYGGTALEVAGGLLSANPEAVLAPAAGVLGTMRQGARAGAYGGALAGYGAGEGLQDSVEKGIAGGALGATLGAGISGVSARYAPRGLDPELAAASQAEGVDLLRPMVDRNAISDYGALESNIYSQPIIRGGAARVRGQIEDRTEALAQGGTPLETEAAGGIIQDSARRFIQRTRGVADNLYNRARNLAGDARVTPRAALAQLRQEMTALREAPNTNAGELDFINGLGEDISSGPLSVEAIRGLRTSIRGRINEQGLTATQAEARATRILNALQEDATASLPPAAATAFRRADGYYRERMVHIDDVLDRFLGGNVERGQARLSGEQAFGRLKSMTSPGGDGRRLAALMRDLDPHERQDIAATIAQSLGRRSPDEPFSTALFVSQTRKLSPSARRTIFGPDGAQSIDNLRLLSRRLEEAERDINRSRSATVLERQGFRMAARNFIATIAGLGGTAAAASGHLAGGAAGITVAGTAMAGSAVRRVLSARATVNPRVSRWLAEAADVSTPAQAQIMVRRLGTIAAREPALAGELAPLQRQLTDMLSPAAASEEEQQQQVRDQ